MFDTIRQLSISLDGTLIATSGCVPMTGWSEQRLDLRNKRPAVAPPIWDVDPFDMDQRYAWMLASIQDGDLTVTGIAADGLPCVQMA